MILFNQNVPEFSCFCQALSNTPKSLKQPYFNMLNQDLSLNFASAKYTPFAQTGLNLADASGNLVGFTVTGGSYSGVTSPIGVSGGSILVDNGATVTYNFANPVTSNATGKQYLLGSVTGSASPITVSAAGTVTGVYVTQYQVTFFVGPSGSGSTSPAGTNVWENAGSLSITATPGADYTFSTWSQSDTGIITFNNNASASTTATISGTGSITAIFVNTYTIRVTQGTYGVIAPGTTTVNYGGSQTFTITPIAGYSIASLTVDGSPVAVASSYTFTNVQASHTITATFALTPAPTPTPAPTATPTITPTPSLSSTPTTTSASPQNPISIYEILIVALVVLIIAFVIVIAVLIRGKRR
jgi:hypothetical protein